MKNTRFLMQRCDVTCFKATVCSFMCVCFVILEPPTVKNELNSQYNRAFIAALKQSPMFV